MQLSGRSDFPVTCPESLMAAPSCGAPERTEILHH